MKMLSTFSPEDAPIISWFVMGLHHEMIRLAKKQRSLKQHEYLTLNIKLRNTENEGTEEVDSLVSPRSFLCLDADSELFIEEALRQLTVKQQRVIRAIILQKEKEINVANELGISQTAIHRIKSRALNKLKNYFMDGVKI